MPLAPEISAAPASTQPYSLTVAGNELIVPTSGNTPSVALDSVTIVEQGPPGVSSLRFTYQDPLAVGRIPVDGDEVQMWDRTNVVPLFRGWVQTWPTSPLEGGQGRTIAMRCVGIEVVLDWALLPADLTLASGLELYSAIQSIVANVPGLGPVNAAAVPNQGSSQAHPVDSFFVPVIGSATLTYALTIPAGTSLRDALGRAATAANIVGRGGGLGAPVPAGARFTVDFYYGLRAMQDSAAGAWASDYVNLTVTDTQAGAIRADGLEHTIDASSIIRGVYITGANAAGSGYLADGTGRPGQIAYISDPTIDTAAKLAATQAAYLNAAILGIRGGFELQDWTPTAGVHPGSLLILTDAATGATGTYRVMSITKTFTGARQSWRIAYGGLPPSLTRLLRSLTRDIRS